MAGLGRRTKPYVEQKPNPTQFFNKLYGLLCAITSICQLLVVINRHNAGEVLIENEELLAVATRYVSGGLEAEIMELSTIIQYLTEPNIKTESSTYLTI
jgi:hypothetical protein